MSLDCPRDSQGTLSGFSSHRCGALEFVPVGARQQVRLGRRPLQGLMGAPPVGAHRVIVPQRGRLGVAHPLGVAGVVTRLHQEGLRAEGLEVPVGEVGLVVLTAEKEKNPRP